MLNSVNNYGYNGFQNASALFVKAAAANPGEGFQGSKALENAGKGGAEKEEGKEAVLTGAALMHAGLSIPAASGDYCAYQIHLVTI